MRYLLISIVLWTGCVQSELDTAIQENRSVELSADDVHANLHKDTLAKAREGWTLYYDECEAHIKGKHEAWLAEQGDTAKVQLVINSLATRDAELSDLRFKRMTTMAKFAKIEDSINKYIDTKHYNFDQVSTAYQAKAKWQSFLKDAGQAIGSAAVTVGGSLLLP